MVLGPDPVEDGAPATVLKQVQAVPNLVVRQTPRRPDKAAIYTCTEAHAIISGSSRLQGYAVREELPLPTEPPYTAHLGNLSFEVTENDVQDFLSGCEVTSVRIIEDKLDRRPKGFGYVTFGTVDGLKKALTLSETQFQGRNIRVSVADPRKSALCPMCNDNTTDANRLSQGPRAHACD